MLLREQEVRPGDKGLFLIGPPGAGKTTLLPHLSSTHSLDTDIWIANENQKTILQIYQEKGEEFLVKEEERCLRLNNLRDLVVASSGSVIFTKAKEYVKKHSLVIFIDVSPSETILFLEKDQSLDRIVIGGDQLLINLEKRQKLYADWADYQISRNDKSVQETAKEILALWNNKCLRLAP